MQSQLAQLRRIRDLRADQRRRDHLAAAVELTRAEQAVAGLRRENREVQAAIQAGIAVPPGVIVSAAEIARQQGVIEQLKAYLPRLEQRIVAAERTRRARERDLAQALAARRAAEKAAEQIGILDERVTQEEIRLQELIEEMQEEPRAKPPLLDRGSGP